MKTDPDLREDVVRELAWDTRVDHRQIAVSALNGVVTLAGEVPSWGARNAAAEVAHRGRFRARAR
jgi:osmotically-inducible protein OsmY